MNLRLRLDVCYQHLGNFMHKLLFFVLLLSATLQPLYSYSQTQPPVDLATLEIGRIRPLKNPLFSFFRQDKNLGFFDNATRPIVFELIDEAKVKIDIEIYEMKDENFRNKILDSLKRKVKVRIIKDPSAVGDGCDELDPTEVDLSKIDSKTDSIKYRKAKDCNKDKLFVAKFISLGGVYRYFNKKELCAIPNDQCYMHGKMLIQDDQKVLLSTGNWNPTSFCQSSSLSTTCNRDFSFVTKNRKMIRTLKSIYEHDFVGQKYDLKSILKKGSHALTVSPYAINPLIQMIKSAKKSIWLNNQYLREGVLIEALMDAAKNRGVSVHIMLEDTCHFGTISKSDQEWLPILFPQMEASGIELKFFTKKVLVKGHVGYLHAKSLVVDEEVGWVGSVNGSEDSLYNNREFGVVFKMKKSVRELVSILKSDFYHPAAIDWHDALRCIK
ncbi:MAG: phospholipase D-like domain-containing protein [Bacteriovoracaceae bacterium]|nr:phospholipase D-like domain-containing protein [Bacteriovoracaceae bacterium]